MGGRLCDTDLCKGSLLRRKRGKKKKKKKEGSRVEDKLGCEAIPVTASSDTLETCVAEMVFRVALTQRPFCSPVSLSLDVGCPREGAWPQLYSGGKQRRPF